jgi:hypothetical protein
MSREPLTREGLIMAVAAILAQGVAVWSPLTGAQLAWVQALIGLAAVGWTVIRVRPKVTPLVDPRDDNGTPLVPLGGGHE